MLIELSNKHNLHHMNARENWNRTWTREIEEEKSILDYFLIKKADVECYEKLEIAMNKKIKFVQHLQKLYFCRCCNIEHMWKDIFPYAVCQ